MKECLEHVECLYVNNNRVVMLLPLALLEHTDGRVWSIYRIVSKPHQVIIYSGILHIIQTDSKLRVTTERNMGANRLSYLGNECVKIFSKP